MRKLTSFSKIKQKFTMVMAKDNVTMAQDFIDLIQV